MGYRIRQFSATLVLVGTIVLLMLIGLNNLKTQPALASIYQMEEAPKQILIQSRHTLQDEKGDSWQVVLFKRSKANGSSIINLRLVDFPGKADFAHPQLLQISTAQGELFAAEDMFAQTSPAPNVGQFDVKDILSQLPISKLNLSLKIKGDRSLELSIPPEVVLEWKSLAAEG